MNSSTDANSTSKPKDYFVTTRWTVVLSAGHKSSAQSDEALAELCQAYWYPLYAYVRRQGRSREEAEDLTQSFFASFLQRNYLEGLKSERGKFRAFLLASLKNFLANEWDKANRQKRGGGALHLSLDWQSADHRYQFEVQDAESPDRLFDREWAVALLERVLGQLQAENSTPEKARVFAAARSFLMLGRDAIPYERAAQELGMAEGALRVSVHRLRQRYRALLREEIAQTLSDPAAVEEELAALKEALLA
jgi:RNA polymerase sigma-70 factor (ECF subfamily)